MKKSITAVLKKQRQIEKAHLESYYFLMAARELERTACPKCSLESFPCLFDEADPSKVSLYCDRCKSIFSFSEEEKRTISTMGQHYTALFAVPPF